MKIKPYRLEGGSPLDHMAMENVLLDTGEGSDALLLFYINEPSVIIGRNQNPWREATLGESAPGTTLPLFRRISGGGAVYHDRGNLNWALIVPRELHDQDAELAFVAAAISAQGFDVVPGERGGLYVGPSSPYAGKKVSGTARRFGARRVLHHGTLLVDADMRLLHASLHGIETFDDASLTSVPAHPVNLCAIKLEIAIDALIEGISRHLTGTSAASLPASFVGAALLDVERQRLASSEWIWEATPPFSVPLRSGSPSPALRVEKGRISRLLGFELSGFRGSLFSIPVYEKLKTMAAEASRRAEEAQ
ncbi:MAG: lipoate--protein ligase family protein [Rectinemataceae bacterium]|nr:lipoate--protein ligase family protein [Rectinemataceae bacterium]